MVHSRTSLAGRKSEGTFRQILTDQQIGRYLIQRRLGSGGVATVYQAYDQVLGQSVALKVLPPTADEKTLIRFRREAMTSGALRHPHIVRTIQVGVAPHGDVAYIAMDLIEGESLSALLNRRVRLHAEESCNLLAPIAAALAHAHQNGIIHRDVKPSNILLQPVGPGVADSVQLESLDYPVVPMLSDFGIARSLDAPELTNTGRTIGTPAYMAPEQCAGKREVDGRADIYSLGAVLYRCLVGRPPFSGTTTQILHAHVYEPLIIEDGILRLLPPLVVDILQRSLSKQPADRYASAQEMAQAMIVVSGRPLAEQNDFPLTAARDASKESTGTITLSLPQTSGNEGAATSVTVLIPGSNNEPVAPPPPPPQTKTATALHPAASSTSANSVINAQSIRARSRSFAERIEHFNWAGLAVLAVGTLAAAFVVAYLFNRISGVRMDGAATVTPTARPTAFTSTPSGAGILAATPTPIPSNTPIPTPTVTPVDTSTPTSTLTPTPPPTFTPTWTSAPPTNTPFVGVEPTATWTPNLENTSTMTPTPGETATPTATLTPTLGPTETPTIQLTPPTPTWTPPAN
ncbi:MAG: serine/threonine-protein kinase [Caldilineaceae bacterium]